MTGRKGDRMKKNEYETKVLVNQMLFRLINRERNAGFLETHPYIPVKGNLALVFLAMDMRDKMHISFSVADNSFMEKMWGRPVEELYHPVLENTMRLFPPDLITLDGLLEEIGKDTGVAFGRVPEEFPKMYVLTNIMKKYGAAVLAYPGTLKKVGEMLGSDFAILPSSIHEVILMPGDFDTKDFEAFADMVRYVNREHVEEQDVLDDTVYVYRRDRDEIILPLAEAL